jgi:CheY-like chemotaxis protein/HPt (histidine-containing phosphotransfer) domain-containing protein
MKLENQSFHLQTCVSEALDFISYQANSKNITLSCIFDEQVPEVLVGDVTRLRQILVNLLSNAVKFTPRGEVGVTVTLTNHREGEGNGHEQHAQPADKAMLPQDTLPTIDSPLRYLHIAVHDTGIGIPQDQIVHLFQPFVQADSSTTRKYGGTGLGLVISKRLAELMGGTIWVESTPGEGSIFHVTVIAVPSSLSEHQLNDLRGSRNRPLPQMASSHPLRILVAEDNLVNQKVVLRLMERMGYRADVAANGNEVLQALGLLTYDVILMDIQMPEMDGVEATRHIRSQFPSSRQPWIIALTAHALQGDKEWLMEAGLDDYVSKPVRVQELVVALEKANKKKLSRQLAGSETIQPADHTAKGREEESIPQAAEQNGTEEQADALTASQSTAAESREPLSPEHTTAALDTSVLREFREMIGEDADDLFHELIDTYLDDAPGVLRNLRAGVEQADAASIAHEAHTLKSNCSQIGALSLATLCEELEAMGRSGNLREAASHLIQAEHEFQRVRDELNALKETV